MAAEGIVDSERAVFSQICRLSPQRYEEWQREYRSTKGSEASHCGKSLKVFDNRPMEWCTRSKWWWPPAFYTLPSIFMWTYGSVVNRLNVLELCLYTVLGWVVWSFIEYNFHRFVMHHTPRFPFNCGVHFLLHGLHHVNPKDEDRLVLNPIVSAPLVALFSYFVIATFPARMSLVVVGTALFCYANVYEMYHYSTHKFNAKHMNPTINALLNFNTLKTRHMVHHYTNEQTWYCISPGVFDFIFGTSFQSHSVDSTQELHQRPQRTLKQQ